MKLSVLLLVALTLLHRTTHAKLPSSITVCKRNDPNMSQCIIKAIKELQPKLINGDLGDGFKVPPIEPFSLTNIVLGDTRDFTIVISNVVAHGPSGFVIDKLRANVDDLKFDVLVSFPKLEIKGKYDLKLQILNTPFKSKGDIILKLENYRARLTMKASKYTKNGSEYIKFENFTIKIMRGNVKLFKLTNLFNGQKSLEEAANTLFINNSDFFLVNIYPQLEKNLAEHFTKIANEITGEASLDELFPMN